MTESVKKPKHHENAYGFTDEQGKQHTVFGNNEACAALDRMFKKFAHTLESKSATLF